MLYVFVPSISSFQTGLWTSQDVGWADSLIPSLEPRSLSSLGLRLPYFQTRLQTACTAVSGVEHGYVVHFTDRLNSGPMCVTTMATTTMWCEGVGVW